MLAEAGAELTPERLWICGNEYANSGPFRLLRARCERPRRSRAAEQNDEPPRPHSITPSARASNVGGTSRPRTLAACRLMHSSNFVDCTTGKSAGFAPLRIRPA